MNVPSSLLLLAALSVPGLVSATHFLNKRVISPVGPVVWISPSPTSAVGQCYPLAFEFTSSIEPEYFQVISYSTDQKQQIRTKFDSFLPSDWVDSTTRMSFTMPTFPYAAGTLVYFLIRGSDGGASTLQGTAFTVQQSDISDCLTSNSTGASTFSTMTGQGQFTTFTSNGASTLAGSVTSSSSTLTTTANGNAASPSGTTAGVNAGSPSSAADGLVASNTNSLHPSSTPSTASESNSSTISIPSNTSATKSNAGAIGGGVAGGVVVALALGFVFFLWRRTDKRKNFLGRLSLVGSDDKLPESGDSAHPAPEPWTYTAVAVASLSAIPMIPLDNGVRVERDGGPQNQDILMDEIDVLPPIYSDATSRSSPATTSYATSSTAPSVPTTKALQG